MIPLASEAGFSQAARDLSILIRGTVDIRHGCQCLAPHLDALIHLIETLYAFTEDVDAQQRATNSLRTLKPRECTSYELIRLRALLLMALHLEEEVGAYFVHSDPSLRPTIERLKEVTLPRAVEWFITGNAQHAQLFCDLVLILHEMWPEAVSENVFCSMEAVPFRGVANRCAHSND